MGRRAAPRASAFKEFPPLPSRLLIPTAHPPVIVKAEGASQTQARLEDAVDRDIRNECVAEYGGRGADADVAARFDEELRALDAEQLRPMLSRSGATFAADAPDELRSTTLERVRPRIVDQLTPALDAAVREALAADPLELMIVLKQVRRAIELAASAHERITWWRRDTGGRDADRDVREVVRVNLIEPPTVDLTLVEGEHEPLWGKLIGRGTGHIEENPIDLEGDDDDDDDGSSGDNDDDDDDDDDDYNARDTSTRAPVLAAHASVAPQRGDGKAKAARKSRQPGPTVRATVVNVVDSAKPATGGECSTATETPLPATTNHTIVTKIYKMLQLANHPGTSSEEAAHAFQRARQMMTRFQLTEATVLAKGGAAGDSLSGGLVEVRITTVKAGKCTGEAACLRSWMHDVARAASTNFDTRFYYESWRGGCTFSFYGLASGAALSSYAFAAAFNQIVALACHFVPPPYPADWYDPWTGALYKFHAGAAASMSRDARDSYREGLAAGLCNAVDRQLARAKREAKRAMAHARAAARAEERRREAHALALSGQAGAEPTGAPRPFGAGADAPAAAEPASGSHADSDDDAWLDDYDSDGSGDIDDDHRNERESDLRSDGARAPKRARECDDAPAADANAAGAPPAAAEPCARAALERLEAQERASCALVVHTKVVFDNVLAEHKVKLSKGKARTYKRGSCAISRALGVRAGEDVLVDINQRALANNC
jgi:hypothetical protein